MRIKISLTIGEARTLSALSKIDKISPEQYIENVIKGHLKKYILKVYQHAFNQKTIDELALMFGEIEE